SWKWLSEWVDLDSIGSPARLAEILTQLGLETESVRDLSEGFHQVVTVQIQSIRPHPDADRLSLCQVTTGEKGAAPLEIVCGAKNMKVGDKVALAQVGAHLPNGMEIKKSKIRGIESFGMLCSEEELGLKTESE